MPPRKFVCFLGIFTLTLTVTLYLPQTTEGQFIEPRLIPLIVGDPSALPDEKDPLSQSEPETFLSHNFIVYGRAAAQGNAGIVTGVTYRSIPYALDPERVEFGNPNRMPDLETFFEFGGTVELLTTEDTLLEKYDIVMSEFMWGVDQGIRDKRGILIIRVQTVIEGELAFDDFGAPVYDETRIEIPLPEEVQWIELYNTTNSKITANVYLLFSPFVSHPERETVVIDGVTYKVLDALSNLLFGRWELPGKSGRRPSTAFVSAYRNIDYDTVEDPDLDRDTQLAGIPFGSYEDRLGSHTR